MAMVSRLLQRHASGPNRLDEAADGVEPMSLVCVSGSTNGTTAMKRMKKSSESKPSRRRQRKKFFFFSRNNPSLVALEDSERRDEALSLSSSSSVSGGSSDAMQHAQILVSSPAPASHIGKQSNNKCKTHHKSNHIALSSTVAPPPPQRAFCSSFQHGYFEQICGLDTTPIANEQDLLHEDEENSTDSSSNYLSRLPDDPSIQESIECVLAAAATHAAAKPRLDEQAISSSHEDADEAMAYFSHLQTPSSLQQCLLRNRSISALPPRFQSEARLLSPQTTTAIYPEKLVSTPQSFNAATVEAKAHVKATTETHHTKQCACCEQRLPVMVPESWPQRPLLMRPTPNSGTVIQGIRFAGSTEYLWKAQTSPLQWPGVLHEKWNDDLGNSAATQDNDNSMVMCPQCMIMPINNGKELPGQSLVTDFESPWFSGSILVRLRDSQGTTCPERERSEGDCYFDGVHRKYQVVVRGQFKQAIPWTECLAGFQYVRSCPSKVVACCCISQMLLLLTADSKDPVASYRQNGL